MIGRKYTFLVTILIMGLSTFIVGILPSYASIGVAAPVILIALRMLQGLALGGEYGGAATYVAEHAPAANAAPTPPGSRPQPLWACSCP
jgi:MFS family permease